MSDPEHTTSHAYCRTCKQDFSYLEAEKVQDPIVEYVQPNGGGKLHLYANKPWTRCGFVIGGSKGTIRYFRKVPENVCKKCLRLSRTEERIPKSILG